jgi:hypothetical protein
VLTDSTGATDFSKAFTLSATTQNISLGASQTTGTFVLGGTAATGAITLDGSTKTHTLNVGSGATENALTKTINIGTGGVSGSTTTIGIGSINGTTTTLYGTVQTAGFNAITIDTTNLEVTNIKAKDGTSAIVLTDSTGAVTISTALTANGGAVFNENGADVDFRVEGDADANLIFADASTDRVGIGTNAPGYKLDVSGMLNVGWTAGSGIIAQFQRTQAGEHDLQLVSGNATGAGIDSTGALTFGSGATLGTFGTPKMILTSTGTLNIVGAGTAGSTQAISFNGSTPVDTLVTTSGGLVGVGTASPASKLEVRGVSASIQTRAAALNSFLGAPISGNVGVVNDTNSLVLQVANTVGGNTAGVSIAALLEASASNQTAMVFSADDGFGSLVARMRLNSSGNLGLGVTPSPWGGAKAFEAGLVGNYFIGSTAASYTSIGTASYYNGSNWVYARSTAASKYELLNDTHAWYIAPSGTANTTTITNGVSYTIITSGNQTAFGAANNNVGTSFTATSSGTLSSGTVSQNISFTQAMTLDASGNLGVGTTLQNERLRLNSSSASQARMSISYADSTIAFFGSYSGIVGSGNATDVMLSATNVLAFGAGGTAERARITSGGDFVVGPVGGNGSGVVKASDAAGTNQPGSNLLLKGGDGGGTGSSYVAIFTAPGGSSGSSPSASVERVRITPAGQFLVGETANKTSEIVRIGGGTQASLLLDNAGRSNGAFVGVFNDAACFGVSRNPSTGVFYDTSYYAAEVVAIGTTSTSYILFSTAAAANTTPTERARITSGGDLLVGTNDAAQGSGNGNKLVAGGGVWVVNAATADGFSYYNSSAAAYRFYVSAAGTISATNTTISAISDQRLKENIQDLDVGLDKIMALKPRKFDWKEGKGKDIKGDRGWIAQEFEQVFPDLIDEWKDPAPEGEEPYKSVRADLIPVLVKAIQEQQAMINELKAEVAALKGA